MAYLTNGPDEKVVLRLQARKSFSLGLYIQDYNGGLLDISGATLRMVVRKNVGSDVVDDSANLIVNSIASIVAPLVGFARFDLQATDLDHTPGEYYYTVVLVFEGYSAVILRGPLEIEQNTEFSSLGEVYTSGGDVSQALTVQLRNMVTVNVRTGPTLSPGAATFTHEDEQKLDEIYAGMVANGKTLNADMIPDGVEKVMMTVAEREALANIEAGTVEWDDVEDKPNFGSAAMEDTEAFLQPGGVNAETDVTDGVLDSNRVPMVTELRGIVITTDDPPGGNPGVIYLKYTP